MQLKNMLSLYLAVFITLVVYNNQDLQKILISM